MLRKTFFFSICTVVPFLVVEWYARQHFVEYADDEAYLKLAFNRLLNSLVIPATEQPNSPLFGYALTPNVHRTVETDDFTYEIQTNSVGFRTREIAPRDGDEQRLLLFGDSMLFGVGLANELAVAGQLEHISVAAGRPLTVYNYAMLHFSTVQSLIAARTFAPQLAPNHMLLGIFVANDLLPNSIAYADENNHLAYSTTQIERLRTALHGYINPLMPSIALRAWALQAWMPRLRYAFSSEKRFLDATHELIDQFTHLATSLDAQPSVVIIYPRYALENSIVRFWSGSRQPGLDLAKYCRQRNIAVLDLLDHMDGNSDAKRYYYTTDGHFNGAGNTRVAQVIYSELLSGQRNMQPDD
ncbi:MAG: hypothetical protein VXW00_13880 [Candidatus Latescibacterota bacterium]|nr:hypothetical protein [Candidatus Latescibacterota bacterium]